MIALVLAAALQPSLVDTRIADAMKRTGTPALAVAVVQDDRVVYRHTFASDDKTRFYLASAAKPFTALAARQLAAEGRLDLDAPLSATLPALRLPQPLDSARMSLRDLLTHRLGFECDAAIWRTSYSGEWSDESLFSTIAGHSSVTPRVFKYDNLGYILATYAAERAAAQPWPDVLRSRVLAPLGMTQTTAEPCIATKSVSTMNRGAGGLCSTIDDMTRWLRANMAGGFAPAVMREVHAPQIGLKKKFGRIDRYAYALGWYHGEVDGELLVHSSGSFPGSWAHVSWMPERRLGVVVLSSAENPLPEAVAMLAYDVLRDRAGAETRFEEDVRSIETTLAAMPERLAQFAKKIGDAAAPGDRTLDSYAGTYRDDGYGTIRVEESGGALVAVAGERRATLVRARGDVFYVQWLPGDAPDRLVFSGTSLQWRGRALARE